VQVTKIILFTLLFAPFFVCVTPVEKNKCFVEVARRIYFYFLLRKEKKLNIDLVMRERARQYIHINASQQDKKEEYQQNIVDQSSVRTALRFFAARRKQKKSELRKYNPSKQN
jgi:hypothetical protein